MFGRHMNVMKNLYKLHEIYLQKVLRMMAFKKMGVTGLVF